MKPPAEGKDLRSLVNPLGDPFADVGIVVVTLVSIVVARWSWENGRRDIVCCCYLADREEA